LITFVLFRQLNQLALETRREKVATAGRSNKAEVWGQSTQLLLETNGIWGHRQRCGDFYNFFSKNNAFLGKIGPNLRVKTRLTNCKVH